MNVVLVTGANGALGRSVVARLRETGRYSVVTTSRRPHNATDLQLDVCNAAQLSAVISNSRPNLILHLAATFANDFDEAYAVNVEATRFLLDAVQLSGRRTRVLLMGSAAEYGLVKPDENPVGENRVLNPVSIYGLTKAWQTQLAGLYAGRGVDVAVARIFNLDGPGMSEQLFIGRLQKQIEDVMTGRASVIKLGPLSAIRDYISTAEAADQILAIAEYADTGRVYHVASGIPVTMRDVLDRYLIRYSLDASIVRESPELTNRIGHDVPAIYADITRTAQLLEARRNSVKA